MTGLFKGKRGGVMLFAAIALLVTGGLGWVTREALRLETEQARVQAESELYGRLRLALWRLDSKVLPELAKEAARPYNHYSAVFAPSCSVPPPATKSDPKGSTGTAGKAPVGSGGTPTKQQGQERQSETLLDTSPLLSGSELPTWMLLHFQTDLQAGSWSSPQVLSTTLASHLKAAPNKIDLAAVTPERQKLLSEVSKRIKPETLSGCLVQEATQREEQVVNPRFVQNAFEQQTQLADGRSGESANQQKAGNPAPNNNDAGKLEQQLANKSGQAQSFDRGDYGSRMARSQIARNVGGKQTYEPNDIAQGVLGNGEWWLGDNPSKGKASAEPVLVKLGALTPLWVPAQDGSNTLVAARLVEVGPRRGCQGIVLDWVELQRMLAGEIEDLLPDVRFRAVADGQAPNPDRTMTALPVEIEPTGSASLAAAAIVSGWTPLRIGLTLAWVAAAMALIAVGLGGWSLIDLSERRIRFVSAVTHELRTPLTTLRLYLDMLTGGFVTDEKQKGEYLSTLHSETERLNRLVANVLDFARLEGGRTQLQTGRIAAADLLSQVQSDWEGRCRDVEKKLVVENTLPAEAAINTDASLVQRILGNLIDNACKYSRSASDNRIHLRAALGGAGSVVFEVADHGAGVPVGERRAIFRAFRQGAEADPTAGGVGLGLALAKRWAGLLRGSLNYRDEPAGGACFALELSGGLCPKA